MTDPKRATGRTLGLALQAIGKAVQNPGTEVEFINHNPQNYAQHHMCKRQIELIAKTLCLDISVEIRSNKLDDRFRPEPFSVFIKSDWVSPYSQRTPVEEAYKNWWGEYPGTEIWTDYDETRWVGFKAGYEFAYAISTAKEVMEKVQEEPKPFMTNCVITGNPPDGYVTWNEWYNELGSKGILHNLRISSKNYEPTPQTPEQVADGLKEAFREAVKQGVIPPVEKKQKTLTDLIERWWCDVFTIHSDWNMETSIDDLVDRIQLWLPKEQIANSQNTYVELTVEGFNDAIKKIKSKLR